MRRYAVIICSALLAALLALAGTASAQTVTANLGRRSTFINHPAGSAVGQIHATAQGQLLSNGTLRGRAADLEIRGVKRMRQYYALLKVWRGHWVNVAVRSADLVAASYIVGYTPARALCDDESPLRWYQVQQVVGGRWNDDTVTNRTVLSNKFQAPMLADDPLCEAPPPPPPPTDANLSITKTAVETLDAAGDPAGIQPVDDTFNYVITVTNVNDPANATDGATATDVDVLDTWPTDLDGASVTATSGCTVLASGNVACSVASLASGATTTFTITGRTNGTTGTAFTNQAALVDLNQPDPVLTNNSVTLTTNTVAG